MGRCMYSGDLISLDELFTDAYDIDHIFPRSMTKDDSFDNTVLVKAKLNREVFFSLFPLHLQEVFL